MELSAEAAATLESMKATKLKTAVEVFRGMRVKKYDDLDKLCSHYRKCEGMKTIVGFGETPAGGAKFLPVPKHSDTDGTWCPGCVALMWAEACRQAGAVEHLGNRGRYGTPYANL